MIPSVSRRQLVFIWFAALLIPQVYATESTPATTKIHYTISLAHASEHLVQVELTLPPGAPKRDVQMPVWNALYQVRDFSQYINWIRAISPDGQPLALRKLDKSTWRIDGVQRGARVQYETFADQAGPFNAQLNLHHAFFNLAQLLIYPSNTVSSPIHVHLADIPAGWRIATPLTTESTPDFDAENYDRLVDSPVELSNFRETSFDEGGAHYRIAVDADPADYDMQSLSANVRKIVIAATSWMQDRPFQDYLFIYHFPRGPAGGGMEHAYSTAIDVSADRLSRNPSSIIDVSSHEFFHLWNVKRIRPQSLEPIDYTRENHTTALWFSEGFTSTAANYIRLRAGLMDEAAFLHAISTQITELEGRPAHRFQSAEESSLDAWLEKYEYYSLPQRSISYYNKGYLIGILLDLQLRESSHGRCSLRDLFQWMNAYYAKKGLFFPDTNGVQGAAEAVAHADLHTFFDKYVAGTSEIPYDDFFRTVGLHLARRIRSVPDPGFRAVTNFSALPAVAELTPQSAAAQAGLALGDTILKIAGQTPTGNLERQISELKPGDTLQLRIQNDQGSRDLSFLLGSREEVEFVLQDADNISPRQRARRLAWLAGESQQSGDAHP